MEPIEEFLQSTARVPLIPAPTPLHRLRRHPAAAGVEWMIKRDDMTGIGPGGNKVRSLEFLLGEAEAQGATKVLAAGPPQSNLCVLTAAACARAGLECELVINGDEPERKEGNLLLESLLGVKTHFLGNCDGSKRNAQMQALAEEYRRAGEKVYVVRNGATSGRGALGYAAAAVELRAQCRQMGIERMTVFAPGGNGGVAAGLIYGNALLGQPFDLVIVSVEDDEKTLRAHIRSVIQEAETITGLPMQLDLDDAAQITDAYRGNGWGENTKESEQAVLSFARSEGIFLENVYNSKVFVGMTDWVDTGRVNGTVCYLHTGGFGSLFAQY